MRDLRRVLGMEAGCCEVADRHIPTFVMDNFIRRFLFPPKKKISKFISSGNVAADIGCGPGYFAIPMAELVGKEGRVYAVDSDPKSIDVVRRKSEAQGLQPVIEPQAASAASLRFIPDRSVDFVFANGVLCCMLDHQGAVSEIKRILAPGGAAYLSVAKFSRRNDPRAVRKDEWGRILGGFKVKESGESLFSRWVTVSLKDRPLEEH